MAQISVRPHFKFRITFLFFSFYVPPQFLNFQISPQNSLASNEPKSRYPYPPIPVPQPTAAKRELYNGLRALDHQGEKRLPVSRVITALERMGVELDMNEREIERSLRVFEVRTTTERYTTCGRCDNPNKFFGASDKSITECSPSFHDGNGDRVVAGRIGTMHTYPPGSNK